METPEARKEPARGRPADPAAFAPPRAAAPRDAWIAGAAALALYAATASRQLGLPDSAIAVDAMHDLVLGSHACNHSLHNLLGWIWLRLLPGAGLAWKANLLSAVYGGAAVGLFHAALRALGLGRVPAAGAAAALAVSHSMWWHATRVENYALSAALFAGLLLLAANDLAAAGRGDPGRRLCAMFFLAGLAVLNHLQNAALVLGAAAYALARAGRGGHGRRLAGRCAAALALGLAPYAAVFAADALRSGDPAETLRLAIGGGGFESLMFRYRLPVLARLGDWILLQFPSPFLLFVPVGLVALPRTARLRPAAALIAAVLLVNTAFFLGYETWDQFSFYLLSFVALAAFGAAGAAWLLGRPSRILRRAAAAGLALSAIAPPMLYPRIGRWAEAAESYWGRRYHAARAAYRGRYDLVGLYTDPIRHDHGTVEGYVRALFARAPEGAMVIDDVSLYYQMEHLRRHEGWRPDLDLRLLRPLGMAGWGETPERLVAEALACRRPVLLTATNGPLRAVLDPLVATGRAVEPFPLKGGAEAFRLARDGSSTTPANGSDRRRSPVP